MIYNREGGYREKVEVINYQEIAPPPPQAHRAHGSTTNADGGQVNLTLCCFQQLIV